jgi:signal transduction histidine kinase
MIKSFQLSSFNAVFDCVKATMKPNLSEARGEGALFIYLVVNLHQMFEHYKIVPLSFTGLQDMGKSLKIAKHINSTNRHIPVWIINKATSANILTEHVKEFVFPEQSPNTRGCFVLAWSPQGSAIICVRQNNSQQIADEDAQKDGSYDFCWSFDQGLIEVIISNFSQIIATHMPSLLEEFQMSRLFVQNAHIYPEQKERLQDELKNLEEQLDSIFSQVEDQKLLSEAVPFMAAKMLTHDLRAQTQNLVMALDMIATNHFDQQQKDSFLKAAQQSANQLLGLVQQLYNITSDQKESFHINWEAYRVQDVIDSLFNALLPTQIYSAITLTSSIPKDLPPIWGDKMLTLRIFQNIIFNAIRFTPPNGEIRIELVPPKHAHELSIAIINIGTHISNAAIEQIDERIKNPQATLKARSGIGLVFCKQAIQAQHGSFQIERYEQIGTKVTLSFLTSKPDL